MDTQLKDKVRQMRELQKRYFRERSSVILNQCKAAEREVDALVAKEKPTEQKKLFLSLDKKIKLTPPAKYPAKMFEHALGICVMLDVVDNWSMLQKNGVKSLHVVIEGHEFKADADNLIDFLEPLGKFLTALPTDLKERIFTKK